MKYFEHLKWHVCQSTNPKSLSIADEWGNLCLYHQLIKHYWGVYGWRCRIPHSLETLQFFDLGCCKQFFRNFFQAGFFFFSLRHAVSGFL